METVAHLATRCRLTQRTHALRHYCATTMLSNGADPQDVQRMLRHASMNVTLSVYVHWLPRANRATSIVGTVLGNAAAHHRTATAPRAQRVQRS